MAAAYHLEALRKQRVLERALEARQRINESVSFELANFPANFWCFRVSQGCHINLPQGMYVLKYQLPIIEKSCYSTDRQ